MCSLAPFWVIMGPAWSVYRESERARCRRDRSKRRKERWKRRAIYMDRRAASGKKRKEKGEGEMECCCTVNLLCFLAPSHPHPPTSPHPDPNQVPLGSAPLLGVLVFQKRRVLLLEKLLLRDRDARDRLRSVRAKKPTKRNYTTQYTRILPTHACSQAPTHLLILLLPHRLLRRREARLPLPRRHLLADLHVLVLFLLF